MTVKELIEQLLKLPQHYEVIQSKDAEGNGFSPHANHSVCMYLPDTTWSGEVLREEDAAEYGENGIRYEENAVVLWPTN